MPWNSIIIGIGQVGMGYDIQINSKHYVYSHSRALSLHPEFNLVAAVDLDPLKRAEFQTCYGVPAYAELDEALVEKELDFVVVATPTSTHSKIIQRILDFVSPKAILCEKPLTYTPQESRQILKVCSEKNVPLYVNYIRRSDPGAIEIKRRICDNEIALPVKGTAWYTKGFLHNGSHLFNLLQYWLGAVYGFDLVDRGTLFSSEDAEPDIRVRFKGGDVFFVATKEENFSYNSIELIANNGRLRYEDGGRHIVWQQAQKSDVLNGYKFLSEHEDVIPSYLNNYQTNVLDQLAQAINGNQADLCVGSEALQTLEEMHWILGEKNGSK